MLKTPDCQLNARGIPKTLEGSHNGRCPLWTWCHARFVHGTNCWIWSASTELCTATPACRVRPKRDSRSKGPSDTPGRSAGTRTSAAAATVHATPSASRHHRRRGDVPSTSRRSMSGTSTSGSEVGASRPTPGSRTPGAYAPTESCSMTPTTRSRSASERLEPLGRHRPWPKIPAATPPPIVGLSEKRGWRCSGFQVGRASMSCASSATRTVSGVAPKTSESISDARQPIVGLAVLGTGHEGDPREWPRGRGDRPG